MYNEHIKDKNSKIYKHINFNKHNMPKSNIKLELPLNKCRAITIFENLFIDKIKEDDKLICLNEQIDLNYTPIYKFLKTYLKPIINNKTHNIP